MMPDMPSWSATRYVPYAATSVRVSSTRWSSTVAARREITKPDTAPTTTLPTVTPTNWTAACPGSMAPCVAATAIVNATMPVPVVEEALSLHHRGQAGRRVEAPDAAWSPRPGRWRRPSRPPRRTAPSPGPSRNAARPPRIRPPRARRGRRAAGRLPAPAAAPAGRGIGGLEHEPGEQHQQDQLGAHLQVDRRGGERDRDAEEHQRDRVRQAHPTRHQRDEGERDQERDEGLDGLEDGGPGHARMLSGARPRRAVPAAGRVKGGTASSVPPTLAPMSTYR